MRWRGDEVTQWPSWLGLLWRWHIHTQTLGALPVTDWRSCHLLQLDPAVSTRHHPAGVFSGRCWEQQSNWASSVLCVHSDWSRHQGKWLVSYLHFVLLLLPGFVYTWFPYLYSGCSDISACAHSSKALKFTRTIISVGDNSNISATGNFLYHPFTTPMCVRVCMCLSSCPRPSLNQWAVLVSIIMWDERKLHTE